jgi:hypothetical protein
MIFSGSSGDMMLDVDWVRNIRPTEVFRKLRLGEQSEALFSSFAWLMFGYASMALKT